MCAVVNMWNNVSYYRINSISDNRGLLKSLKGHAANRCNIMATTERRVESISELTLDNRNIPQPSLLLKNGSNDADGMKI